MNIYILCCSHPHCQTVFNLYNNTQNNREIRVKDKKNTRTHVILSRTKETEKVLMCGFFFSTLKIRSENTQKRLLVFGNNIYICIYTYNI